MADTKTVVVVADGIGYKVPGQDRPGARETYVTVSANRGEKIELDADDADRFLALGAVVHPDAPEAEAAKSPKLPGVPYGAVRIASENDNTPVQQLRKLAVEKGAARPEDFGDEFAREHADLLGDDEGAVSGAAPADIDLSDKNALGKLNAAQLKGLAAQHGVEVESGDTKKSIAAKIAKASGSS